MDEGCSLVGLIMACAALKPLLGLAKVRYLQDWWVDGGVGGFNLFWEVV